MEVGYWEAMRARREQPGPIAEDFDNLERLAKNAVAALIELINHLEPRAAVARDLALPILTAQAGIQEGSARERHLQAEKDASILWAARETVLRLKEAAPREEARVREGRQNPGKPRAGCRVETRNSEPLTANRHLQVLRRNRKESSTTAQRPAACWVRTKACADKVFLYPGYGSTPMGSPSPRLCRS